MVHCILYLKAYGLQFLWMIFCDIVGIKLGYTEQHVLELYHILEEVNMVHIKKYSIYQWYISIIVSPELPFPNQ